MNLLGARQAAGSYPCGRDAPIAGTRRAAALGTAFVLALAAATSTANAANGCLVLLCLAAPSWTAIPQCVPPVRQLFLDIARGQPFPRCAMAGSGNSAGNDWASAPSFCPPQYARIFDGESAPIFACDYVGAIAVRVGGQLFTRTWWSTGGDAVTEFSDAAKAALGTWDTRFDDDYARWLASQPPTPPAAPDSGA